MQVIHNLYINNVSMPLINHNVTQELSAIGRGFFTVDANEKQAPEVGQLVVYDHGYKGKNLARFFLGIIQSITPQGLNQYAFKARELTGVLLAPVHFALRHASLKSVINSLSLKTGLKFVYSDAAYWEKETLNFYSVGSGRDALNSIKSVFALPDFCWQQQSDGSVFVGLYDELPASKQVANVDYSVFDSMGTDGAWAVALLAGIKAGSKINGRVINSINVIENKMVLKCITH